MVDRYFGPYVYCTLPDTLALLSLFRTLVPGRNMQLVRVPSFDNHTPRANHVRDPCYAESRAVFPRDDIQ